ncbi:MAG: type II secretion system F family protein [Endomicrobia bacterium]|nr:type II secretion system F family protein [Endomicrobiia bacterium]
MLFRYSGIDINQKTVNGIIYADDIEQARHLLINGFINVLSIEEITYKSKNKKIKKRDIAQIAESLGEQLDVGISPITACDLLINSVDKRQLKNALFLVKEEIKQGSFLSQAFEEINKKMNIFPMSFIYALKIAEPVGSFTEILRNYAKGLRELEKIEGQIKKALVMPAITLFVSIIVFIIGVTYIIPQFEVIFTSLLEGEDAKLPFLTQIMLNLSKAIRSYWFIIFPLIFVVIYTLFNYVKNNPKEFNNFLLRFPIVSEILVLYNASNYIRNLSILWDGESSIIKRFEIMANGSENILYREMSLHIAETFRRYSPNLSDVFAPFHHLLTAEIQSIVKTIENTGKGEYMLRKFAESLERQLHDKLNIAVQIAENLIIVIPASVVFILLLALYLPLFEFIGRFASR